MESENENDSSESLDMELNRSIRRSYRLSSQNRVEVDVEESDEASWRHSTHSSTRGRGRGRGRGRTSSHTNQSSSEDFEEKESHKRSLRHDSSRSSDEKRRHRSGYEWKEESVRVDRVDRVASEEEAESRGGHTLHQINDRVGERENEFESQDEDELESGYANTVVTKGGVLLTLPASRDGGSLDARNDRLWVVQSSQHERYDKLRSLWRRVPREVFVWRRVGLQQLVVSWLRECVVVAECVVRVFGGAVRVRSWRWVGADGLS